MIQSPERALQAGDGNAADHSDRRAGELPIVIAKIHFGTIRPDGFNVHRVERLFIRDVLCRRNVRAVFLANPSNSELLKLFLLKRLLRRKLGVSVFDLILRRPSGAVERLRARVKAALFKTIDQFLLIHRDWRGYSRHFRVDPSRCRYVPFKPNNLRLLNEIDPVDGDYIVSCGASHRDYDTLLRAVAPSSLRTVIVISAGAEISHNAKLDRSLAGPHVNILSDIGTAREFNQLIARSRLVVVPIIGGTLQPAGISVCLEAMALGKPVIITRGTSTEGILDERVASIVPADDAEALREAIESLWNDRTHRVALGDAARSFALALGDNDRLVGDISRHIVDLVANRDAT